MSMRDLFGLINLACMAICYVLLIIAPSWAWCSAAMGWTAAWYYHYTASVYIEELEGS